MFVASHLQIVGIFHPQCGSMMELWTIFWNKQIWLQKVGYLNISIIQQTLPQTTGPLTCGCDFKKVGYLNISIIQQTLPQTTGRVDVIFFLHAYTTLGTSVYNVHFALRPQKRDGLLGTGTGGEEDEKSEGSTADTARKIPWTAARIMEVLRRCPLTIAQWLVHCAIAVSTAVLGRVTRTMSVAPMLSSNLKQKRSNFNSPAPPPCSWSLLG